MRQTTYLFLVSSLILVAGCTLGPRQIHKSRLRYNEAVQKTFQEEMLLNLVRLKYRDIPEFLKVGGIAAQYSFEGTAVGKASGFGGSAPPLFGLDGIVKRSEKPTISYQPARGESFQRGLLAPVDLVSLQLLARTGWSWDRILRTTVQHMNGVDNAISAGGPTPDRKPNFEHFLVLTHNLRELQIVHGVEIANAVRTKTKEIPLRKDQLNADIVNSAINAGFSFSEKNGNVVLEKDDEFLALIVHGDAKQTQEMTTIANLLKLHIDQTPGKPLVYEMKTAGKGNILPEWKGLYENRPAPQVRNGQEVLPPTGRSDIVVGTRSLLEVMYYLSQGIQIPDEHQAQGLVTTTLDNQGNVFDWTQLTGELLRVFVCNEKPANAAVCVQYKGYWFYIDDRDLSSQSTFSLLIELFGIEVRAGGGGGFLYTLSVGG